MGKNLIITPSIQRAYFVDERCSSCNREKRCLYIFQEIIAQLINVGGATDGEEAMRHLYRELLLLLFLFMVVDKQLLGAVYHGTLI